MKIVFFEDVLTFGGARKSTVELAANLKERGHDVLVIDVRGKCEPFVDYCKEHELNIYILDPQRSIKLLTDTRFKLQILINYIWYFKYTYILNKKLVHTILEFNADYIVVNNSSLLVYFLRKKTNSKIVLFARGWFLPQQMTCIDRFLYRKFVDKYICVSEATRYALISSGLATLSNSFVVHNYINIENTVRRFYWEEHRIPIILVSGGFLETKGLHVAVAVAEQLKSKGYAFKMVITGIIYSSYKSKSYYERIKRIISENNLYEIELIVNRPNVLDYFAKADIFLHASNTEGLPRVVMEAMAYGLPVIANSVGGVTDYVLNKYTGFLVRYNNIADFEKCIVDLFNSHELHQKIVERSYQLIKGSYTKDNQITSFEKSLE